MHNKAIMETYYILLDREQNDFVLTIAAYNYVVLEHILSFIYS